MGVFVFTTSVTVFEKSVKWATLRIKHMNQKKKLRGITKRIPNSSLKTRFLHQGLVVQNPMRQAKDQSRFLFHLNSSAGFLNHISSFSIFPGMMTTTPHNYEKTNEWFHTRKGKANLKL